MHSDDERLAKIRQVLREDVASDFEVQAALQRYRARARRARPRPWWAEIAFGLGFAVVAVGVFHWATTSGPELAPGVARSSVPATPTLAAVAPVPAPPSATGDALPAPGARARSLAFVASIEQRGEAHPVEPGTAYRVAAGESVVVRMGSEVHTVPGPRVLEFQLDPSRASGWRMTTAAVAAAPGVPQPGPGPLRERLRPQAASGTVEDTLQERLQAGREGVPPGPSGDAVQASWAVVAQALREGELGRAEAALGALGASAQPTTRDSARLTLAQVWLSSGRTREARELLDGLAERGATPFIQKRARELLGR